MSMQLNSFSQVLRKPLHWYGVAVVIVVLDQLSKAWAVAQLSAQLPLVVNAHFNLVLAYNTGAAFSVLADAGGWQRHLLSGLAIAAAVWLVVMIYQQPQQRLLCWGLSSILGGAVGNVIDRIRIGAVVDFLDVHAYGWHWPAFNIADSAICVGAGLLIIDSLRRQDKSPG